MSVGILRSLFRFGWAVFAALGSQAALAGDQVADATPRQNQLMVTAAVQPPQVARTRFVIGLDHKVDVQVFSLANPNRVVVELPDVKLQLPNAAEANAKGLISSFRGGLAAPGKTRVVLDVTQPVIVESSKVEKDASGVWRLSLDILPVDDALKGNARKPLSQQPSGLGASGIQPPLPKEAESPKARAARAFKPVIVIDPGHGGMDSGAAKWGTVEKTVVLNFAYKLREQLEATGRYKILMTRDKDVFVELDERRAFAERNHASLFIAIHADYAGTRARGATIFSLRDGVAKDLERSTKNSVGEKILSESEINTVKQANGDVETVRNMLSDLAERDVGLTRERSSVFAKTVIENMSEETAMRSEPDQQAAFRVLKTAQFPSVLIELAYVSNRQDADNLNSDEWREKVSESIVSAVDNYFGNQLARLPM
jgi:N-acetylmuramoyl-L-alanine amidase